MKKKLCSTDLRRISMGLLIICVISPMLCQAKSKKDYVIPISKTEFKIDGRVVDIYKEAQARKRYYMEFMEENIPDGYEEKINGAYIYKEKPEWKKSYKFTKLDGLYMLSVAQNEMAIFLFKKKKQYTYFFTLKGDKWVLKEDTKSRNPYVLNVDKIKGNYCYYPEMAPEKRKEYVDNIMNSCCFKCDTRCDAEIKLDRMLAEARRETQAGRSSCGYECFRVIAMDHEHHIVLLATHYVGLRAMKLCIQYGIDPTSEYAKDYWRVAPQIIISQSCLSRIN